MKISRNRSSTIGIASSSPVPHPARSRPARPRRSPSRPSSSVLSRSRVARRSRSIARLRAVVVIHAPGLAGMPRSGHVSSATMNASWTASSARSKSPSTRMSVATARPCSSRNRRSTTSRVAGSGRRVVARSARRPRPSGPHRPVRVELHDRADLDRAVRTRRGCGRRRRSRHRGRAPRRRRTRPGPPWSRRTDRRW